MKEVKIGLIGAGWMGSYHAVGFAKVTQAYGNEIVPKFQIVADSNEAAAKKASEKFGFAKWTTNWEDVISDSSVDLVIITTPNYMHPTQVIAAANAGKNIVCEKPMAMSLEEGQAMVDAVEKAGVKSLVDFIYRKMSGTSICKRTDTVW